MLGAGVWKSLPLPIISFIGWRALHRIDKSSIRGVIRIRNDRMTISAAPVIKDDCLKVRGKVVLTGMPGNVVLSPADSGSAFLGATSSTPDSRHVFTLGTLEGYRLLCLFRFKIWWMIPRFGKACSEIPCETQLLLLEAREDSAFIEETVDSTKGNTFYILFLPVLDGPFRASLQGNPTNELQFCVESGDPSVQCRQSLEAVFINSGDNPFELLKDSVKILESHKGTFVHLEKKKTPRNLDWFGWCTWDAFYTEVNPRGIDEGLQRLSEGGTPARFLIIDDGWQHIFNELGREGKPILEGTQFACRLVDINENKKFQNIDCNNDKFASLHDFVKYIKEKYGLKYVYMWHALAGYWGGVLPSSEHMKKYNPKLKYPVQSPGNIGNLRDIAMDSLEKYGVGVVDPEKIYEFYNDLHSYLANGGIDGVKVDVQNLIETLGAGHGGRVSLTRQYQRALEDSVAKNFKENNLICCMSHNSDYLFSSKKSAVARASEDFMPREPTLQTLHIASVSFNSLFLGEIVVPDWDLFHSNHVTAEFHGAARAIGGCGVYVSDKPGQHDFKILKKLVLPDGSVLRARYAGRPTRDCLFDDPVMDGRSLLKIWNMNKFSGVIGVFNCQGAGDWPCKEYISTSLELSRLSCDVSPSNVEFLKDVAGENWTGDCAVYAFNTGHLSRLQKNGSVRISLATLECEVYTVSPVKDYDQKVHFAPIGLIDMFNSGGAIESLSFKIESTEIIIKARGCGRFGAYSSTIPTYCLVDCEEKEFSYSAKDGLLTINLEPHFQGGIMLSEISVGY